MLNVRAILTSYNRRDSTVACLRRLGRAAAYAGVELAAVLVDDGSRDGTADAVEQEFPWVRVIRADGNLFWNRGMHLGFAEAMKADADAFLWVNDDTLVREDAIARVVETWRALERERGGPVVVVGATADPLSGQLTYGGDVTRSSLRRFSYVKVWSEDGPVSCEAAQGNFVLVPRAIALAVGNIDPAFEHAMGDLDYTLRVRRAGFGVFVAPGFVGECARNSTRGTFADRSLPLRQRWASMMHRKGLPPRSWLHFTRRHGGPLWPAYFAWPYVRVVLESLRPRRS